MHHVIGVTGVSCALYGGFGWPAISALSNIVEISSVFLNLREMQEDKQSSHPLAVLN